MIEGRGGNYEGFKHKNRIHHIHTHTYICVCVCGLLRVKRCVCHKEP